MIRLGIVGSGFGLYGLVPAFYPIKGCMIAAVCAINQERIRQFCTPRRITHIYSNWREMLKKEKLGAVALAVTPKAQYTIASSLLKNGIPVFAEKPLADTYAHARILASIARKHKVTTALDFMFPEIPQWKKVRALIDSNTYGRLAHITVNWDFLSFDIAHGVKSWKTDSTEGGGALSYYFSHTLYYLELFGGRIEEIRGSLSYDKKSLSGGETGVDCIVRYQHGLTGTAHLSCNSPGKTRHQLIFACKKATIELTSEAPGFADHFQMFIHKGGITKELLSPPPKTKEDKRVLAVGAVASRFISSCRRHALMHPSMQEGLRVQELIEKIRKGPSTYA